MYPGIHLILSQHQLLVRYEGKGEQKIIQLIDKVFRSILSVSGPLEPQINILIRSSHTISKLGLTFDDQFIAFPLISSSLLLFSP